ncbi:MAG TPA: ROK family protein [Anaerolineaceae bacterium]|nr:ROK family protein [Anaerolineaceae bacterium]
MSIYIAVDVGGTQLRVATFTEVGITPRQQARIPTKSAQGKTIDRLMDLIASVWPVDDRVAAIGVAAPGPTNPRLGIVYKAPNIPDWVDLPLRQILEDRFNVPVCLGNDANLAALGEWRFGAGQGRHNILYLTISTGIGAGVICDGHLLLGENGLAGELGHITVLPDGPVCGCGQRGHLEALSSGTAIAAYVTAELAKGRESSLSATLNPNAREISRAAKQGDPLAIEAFARAGKYLGIAITSFLHSLNPSMIILGGGVSQSGHLLIDPAEAVVRASVMAPEYLNDLIITTAALGDNAGLLGALALVRSTEREVI